jgi:hypothetical protein
MPVPSLLFPHQTAPVTGGHRHVLIPYAAVSEMDQALQLPHLDGLLARMAVADSLDGEEEDLCPPHERMAAHWRGWADLAAAHKASLPWAALAAIQQPDCSAQGTAAGAWAFLTPCHWAVGTDQIRLDNPAELQLDEADSRALLAVLAPWFAEDGLQLHYARPDHWLVQGTPLQTLQSASLDRVLLRDVRHWAPDNAATLALQRLHSEVQMLLYNHPWNENRAARGLPPVNAFWLHGVGKLPAAKATVSSAQPEVWSDLREPALLGHGRLWEQAWAALDAGPMAGLLRHVQGGGSASLALCGERSARSYTTGPRGLGARIRGLFSPQRFDSVRKAL